MMIPHMLEPCPQYSNLAHSSRLCVAQDCKYPTEGAIKPRDIKCDDGCCYADLFDVTRIVAIIQFSGLGVHVFVCCFVKKKYL